MLTSLLGLAVFGLAATTIWNVKRLSDAGLELHELRCDLVNARSQVQAQMDVISDRNRVNNEQSERIARLLEMQNDAIRKIKAAHLALDEVKSELDPPF